MAKKLAQSRSFWHPEFEKYLASLGGDLSKVDWVRVVDIYARVSQANDDRFRSTEGQVHDCADIIIDKGLIPGRVCIDDSLSAWDERIVRPAWEEIMQRLESHQNGGMIVFALTRFSRRPKDGERLIDFADSGMKILDSDGGYDLTTPRGRRDFRNALTEAAFYSDSLSKSVRRGKRTKARNGEFNVGFRIYGFDLPGHVVNEHEKVVLRGAATRLLAGESQESILRSINASGERTTRGNVWSRKALREALTRKLNAGFVTCNDAVMSERPDQRIFTPDERDELEAFYAGRRRGRPSPYLLVGVLRCECGQAMYGRDVKNRDGSSRVCYYCNPGHGEGDKVQGCGSSIDGVRAEAVVRQLVLNLLANTRHGEAIAAQESALAEERAHLGVALERDLRTVKALDGKLSAGEIDYDRYDSMTGPINKRIIAARAALKPTGKALPVPAVIDRSASRQELAILWDDPSTTMGQRRTLIQQELGGQGLIVRRATPGRRDFDPSRIQPLSPLLPESANPEGR